MATHRISRDRPTFAALLSGLFDDVKRLARQELQLVRDEVNEELDKAKRAVVSLSLGIGLALIGGWLLILMLVHLLAALTPLPLWASYGLVGLLAAGAGAFLLLRAKNRAGDIHVVPVRTVQTLKENVAWIKEEVASPRT